MTISFEVEALSIRLGSSFGLLHGSGNLLAVLPEVPFLSLDLFLKTSGIINDQHLMLFLDFYLHRFQHLEDLGNHFRHPLALHIIVHHEAFVAWWQLLKNSINNTLNSKINSQLSQVVVVPRHSEYVFIDRTILPPFCSYRTY